MRRRRGPGRVAIGPIIQRERKHLLQTRRCCAGGKFSARRFGNETAGYGMQHHTTATAFEPKQHTGGIAFGQPGGV